MLDFINYDAFLFLITIFAKILVLVIPLLIIVAFLTYAERKVIAAVQLRKGPNVVGPFGLLQPLADGLKLFSKESIFPTVAASVDKTFKEFHSSEILLFFDKNSFVL